MTIQKWLCLVIVSLMFTANAVPETVPETMPEIMPENLTGVWKNLDQPVSIEISFEGDEGIGKVLSNDTNPDSVGRIMLKQVVSKNDGWRGKIYAKQLGKFVDAALTLTKSGQLKIVVSVGFMTRTAIWERIEKKQSE